MNPYFTRKSFNDVVFDQRHKQYGAYVLRSRYNELVLRAFFWLMGTVLLLGFTPSALRIFGLIPGRGKEVVVKNDPPIWDTTIVPIPQSPPSPPAPETPPIVTSVPPSDLELPIVAVDSVPPKKEEPKENPKPEEGTISVRNTPSTDGPGNVPEGNTGTSPGVTGTFPAGVDTSGEQRVAQVEPKFPQGNDRIQPWIVANISHSQIERMELSGGTVYVTFVVERDGSVSNVAILKGLESVIDKEAIRLIKSMPKWEPGRNSDVPVRVRLNLPIKIHRDAD